MGIIYLMNISNPQYHCLYADMTMKSYWFFHLYKCNIYNTVHSETPLRCFVIDDWVTFSYSTIQYIIKIFNKSNKLLGIISTSLKQCTSASYRIQYSILQYIILWHCSNNHCNLYHVCQIAPVSLTELNGQTHKTLQYWIIKLNQGLSSGTM